jgi:hypothetical protein
MEEALKYIAEHWPVVLLVIVVIIVTWRISTLYNDWRHRMRHVEGECKKVADDVMPTLKRVETSTTGIAKTINGLLIYLKGKDGSFDPSLFQSHSPMALTPFGSEILVESGGKKFVDDNLNFLIDEIRKYEIKSPLDVENFAPIVINVNSTLDSFTPVKNFIYNKPIYKSGDLQTPLDIAKVSQIIGIYLRDKFLEKFPHILNNSAETGT